MRSPFPGVDPYLEHPALWPDVHNRLIAGLADHLAPRVAPRYYVALVRMTYRLAPEVLVFVGRPDVAVAAPSAPKTRSGRPRPLAETNVGVIEVEVPVDEEVSENFLEIRDVESGLALTVVELLSPANKIHARGRAEYEAKRREVLTSRTHLVEVDLLRALERMPVTGPAIPGDYRILVSRSGRRPKADMLGFSLRQSVPKFSLPLLAEDQEPEVDLGAVLHALYGRARFDLRLDYARPPEPPLPRPHRDWVRKRIETWRKAHPR